MMDLVFDASYPIVFEIVPLVEGNKIQKVVSIYAHVRHLGHVASIMLIHFLFLVSKGLLTKYG